MKELAQADVPVCTQLTVSEMAPMTQKRAEHVVRCYGFESVADFAESLPADAEILDVGAGASPLGREVTLLRPDVRWTNFDFGYHDPRIRDELEQEAPPNLRHIAGDAAQLDKSFPPNSFDRVFSFWMFPHLSLADTHRATAAAEAAFRVAKIGGSIAIGPVINPPYVPDGDGIPTGGCAWTTKTGNMSADSFAQEAVRQTRMNMLDRYVYRAWNREIAERFGTNRYMREQGGKPEIFDPETGGYIPRHSQRGMQLQLQLFIGFVGRLGVPGR